MHRNVLIVVPLLLAAALPTALADPACLPPADLDAGAASAHAAACATADGQVQGSALACATPGVPLSGEWTPSLCTGPSGSADGGQILSGGAQAGHDCYRDYRGELWCCEWQYGQRVCWLMLLDSITQEIVFGAPPP